MPLPTLVYIQYSPYAAHGIHRPAQYGRLGDLSKGTDFVLHKLRGGRPGRRNQAILDRQLPWGPSRTGTSPDRLT